MCVFTKAWSRANPLSASTSSGKNVTTHTPHTMQLHVARSGVGVGERGRYTVWHTHLATMDREPATKSKHHITTRLLRRRLKAEGGRRPTVAHSMMSVVRLITSSNTRTGIRNTQRSTNPTAQNTVREGLLRRYCCRLVLRGQKCLMMDDWIRGK